MWADCDCKDIDWFPSQHCSWIFVYEKVFCAVGGAFVNRWPEVHWNFSTAFGFSYVSRLSFRGVSLLSMIHYYTPESKQLSKRRVEASVSALHKRRKLANQRKKSGTLYFWFHTTWSSWNSWKKAKSIMNITY